MTMEAVDRQKEGDLKMPTLKMKEGPRTKKRPNPLEAGKGKAVDSLLEPPGKLQPF